MLEMVRVLINEKEQRGLVLNAMTERTAKVIGEFLGIPISIRKGLLLKTTGIYGHECVVVDGVLYPVAEIVWEGQIDAVAKVVDLSKPLKL